MKPIFLMILFIALISGSLAAQTKPIQEEK